MGLLSHAVGLEHIYNDGLTSFYLGHHPTGWA